MQYSAPSRGSWPPNRAKSPLSEPRRLPREPATQSPGHLHQARPAWHGGLVEHCFAHSRCEDHRRTGPAHRLGAGIEQAWLHFQPASRHVKLCLRIVLEAVLWPAAPSVPTMWMCAIVCRAGPGERRLCVQNRAPGSMHGCSVAARRAVAYRAAPSPSDPQQSRPESRCKCPASQLIGLRKAGSRAVKAQANSRVPARLSCGPNCNPNPVGCNLAIVHCMLYMAVVGELAGGTCRGCSRWIEG